MCSNLEWVTLCALCCRRDSESVLQQQMHGMQEELLHLRNMVREQSGGVRVMGVMRSGAYSSCFRLL